MIKILLVFLFNYPIMFAFAQQPDKNNEDSLRVVYEQQTSYLLNVTAPDFEAVDINGKSVRFSDFKGKTIVIDFWFTTCGPCLMSMPDYNNVATFFKDSANIAVLSVCIDGAKAKKRWKQISRKKGIRSINLFLDESQVKFNNKFYIDTIKSFPFYMMIAPDGRILGRAESPHSLVRFTYTAFRATQKEPVLTSQRDFSNNANSSQNWLKQHYNFLSVHDTGLREAIEKYYSGVAR